MMQLMLKAAGRHRTGKEGLVSASPDGAVGGSCLSG